MKIKFDFTRRKIIVERERGLTAEESTRFNEETLYICSPLKSECTLPGWLDRNRWEVVTCGEDAELMECSPTLFFIPEPWKEPYKPS